MVYFCTMIQKQRKYPGKRKSELTRQFIIEETAVLFNQKGYSGTSMHDLTQATGLSKGSIYGNFEDKDAVAIAAFDYNFQQMFHHLGELLVSKQGHHTRLFALPEVYLDMYPWLVERGGCPLLNTGMDADDAHPRLKEKVKTAMETLLKGLEGLLKTGISKGELKEDLDIPYWTHVIYAIIQGGIVLSKTTEQPVYLENAMIHLNEIIQTKLKK